VRSCGEPFPLLMALLHLEFDRSVEGRGFCRYLSPRGPLRRCSAWCQIMRRRGADLC